MKPVLYIESRREGYSPAQCGQTLTVGELVEYLEQFDHETEVYISNDSGYTFGSIRWDSFDDGMIED
jgi:hypothetical protein